ncbi:heterokaryon incompatibility protein-domain-containing protein [Paraphoma chrysanthemicola]|uniref:Heterokaryon incompatibility protein-domain-containing protein n=1 Tax=Paraphoma chrysanthemicola TaxID=798071 RepID=A0A8K0R5C3_9PLEO|nr:heterokaryon incompatibility protein-domain-containing protein [Paraphoma chrysanthemicola]
MAVIDGSDEVEEVRELLREDHATKEIISSHPNGPLTENVYICEIDGKDTVSALATWAEDRENRKSRRRKSRLISKDLCVGCSEIIHDDLERLSKSSLEESQAAVIRLAAASESCKCCSFFARWKFVESTVPVYSPDHPYLPSMDVFVMPATYYFLVSLPAEHFGLAPAGHRFCIVTSKPYFVTSNLYSQITGHELRHWKENQQCLLQMETTSLCPQNRIGHLSFGHEEFESISQWLCDCLASHREECPQTSLRNSSFEMYCIDCEDEKVILMPTDARYFALSYVWGPALASAEDESLSNAPLVIKDAMLVTLRLSFRYLWVDRYCIDQRNALQKHRQIANMSSIYAGATLTLIAAGGTDPEVGLPGVSSCRCNLDATLQLGPYSYVPMFGNPKVAIGCSTWSTRGWTYQEAIMSLRKLVFTSEGFYTQCNMRHSFGSSHPIGGQTVIFPNQANIQRAIRHFHIGEPPLEIAPTVVFPSRYGEPSSVIKAAAEEFFDHISKYMRRQLSFESDRLDAIESVLNDFRLNEKPIFHILGVPFKATADLTINYALFWRMQSNRVQRRHDFPSWSWLGWQCDGDITHQSIILGDLEDVTDPNGTYRTVCDVLSKDKHSARISVEFPGGVLLDLTDGVDSNKALDAALPREARILPQLLICGVIIPLKFEQNGEGEWVRVGDPSRPFYRKSCLLRLRFSMWLDRPAADEQDAFQRNQVRALVLGHFGPVIRLLILRKFRNCWTRIGIGQYSAEHAFGPFGYDQLFYGGYTACEKAYFKTMKKYKKRTIRLG